VKWREHAQSISAVSSPKTPLLLGASQQIGVRQYLSDPFFYAACVNGRRLTISSIVKSFGSINQGPLRPATSTKAMMGRRPSIRHSNTRLPRSESTIKYLRACRIWNCNAFCRTTIPAAAITRGSAILANHSSNPSRVLPERASAFHSYQRCISPRRGKLSMSTSKGAGLEPGSLDVPRPFQNSGNHSQYTVSGAAMTSAVISIRPTMGWYEISSFRGICMGQPKKCPRG